MKAYPLLFSLSLKNLEPKVKFLLESFDLSKAELGQVRYYCLLCSYGFFGTLPCFSDVCGCKDKRLFYVYAIADDEKAPNCHLNCVSKSCFLMYGTGGAEVSAGVGLLARKHGGAC
jgi:hypothetical protein